MKRWIILIMIVIGGCSGRKAEEIRSRGVEGFQLERYLGLWNEAERIDNSFEKDLVDVTARYYVDERGRYRVVNRGYNEKKGGYKEAHGYIRTTEKSGALKVSFFRPFYGDYVILDIDESYSYALVGGGSLDYLWILSRGDEVPREIRERFISKARKLGYDYERLKPYRSRD